MTTKEYMASGKLEMYVLGHLSDQENMEIAQLSRADSELNLEIEKIESAIIQLTSTVSPTLSSEMMDAIVGAQSLKNTNLEKKKKRINWAAITGWTTCLILAVVAAYFGYENYGLVENQAKNQNINVAILAKTDSIKQIEIRNESIVELLRLPATQKYILESEDNSTDVTATVFYNHNELKSILDLSMLPILGQGEVYKLWSVNNTEEAILYKNLFVSNEDKKGLTNLYIIDGVTSDSFMMSIETDTTATEPSAIRFIQKEKQL